MLGALGQILNPRFGAMLLKLTPEQRGTLHVFPLNNAPAPYTDDAFILTQETANGAVNQALIGKAPWIEQVSRSLPNLETGAYSQDLALKVEDWRDSLVDGMEMGLTPGTGSPARIFQGATAAELFDRYRKTADFSKLLNDSAAAGLPWSAMDEHVQPHNGLVLVPQLAQESKNIWSINYWLDKLFLRNEPETTLPSQSSFFQLTA